MKCSGLDLHSKTFRMALLDDDGTLLWEQTQATSAERLVRLVSVVKGPLTVVLEEGTLADWALRVLSPHAKVVVADPRHNRWIAGDENIDDEKAARKLAELLRAGLIHPVHHSESDERQTFKEVVQAYHSTSREVTRFKNKLKAKFRRLAIDCKGSSVYAASARELWLAKLPSRGAQLQVRLLWETLDHHEAQRKRLCTTIRVLSRQFPEIARFEQVPGIGLIRAATIFAFLDTPYRFATRAKLWSYCGLGIAAAKSGESKGNPHLTYFGNRELKNAIKGAALCAMRSGQDNPFRRKYQRLTAQNKPHSLAWLDVSRSMATTLWMMWRTGQDYDPQRPSAAPTGDVARGSHPQVRKP